MALLKLNDGGSQLTPLQRLALGGGIPSPPATGGGVLLPAATQPTTGPLPAVGLSGGGGDGSGTIPSPPSTGGGALPPDGGGGGTLANVPGIAPGTTPAGGTLANDPTVGGVATGGAQIGQGSSTDDLTSDPAYQAQKAEDERLLNQAASGYLANTKDMLLGYGSQELAKSTLDELLKDPRIASIFTPADEATFLQSISANPDQSLSTLGRLARSQRDRGQAADESYNQNNLFYSGPRAKALGDEQYQFQGESADARSKVLDALSKIGASYSDAQNAARAGDLSGYQAAYDRALQEAMQYGTGTDPTAPATTGSGDTSGNSTSTTTPSAKSKGAPKVKPPAAPKVRPAPTLVSEHGRGGGFVTPPKPKKKAAVKPYVGKH